MDPAPEFTNLKDQDGHLRSLSDYRGRWLILYFYPKDDTPGCTTEACSFRDARRQLLQPKDVAVIGVSSDSVESHARFAKKYNLTFPLLSDPDHTLALAYRSWTPVLGTKRNTFVINPAGAIAKRYEQVSPDTHIADIVADLAALRMT